MSVHHVHDHHVHDHHVAPRANTTLYLTRTLSRGASSNTAYPEIMTAYIFKHEKGYGKRKRHIYCYMKKVTERGKDKEEKTKRKRHIYCYMIEKWRRRRIKGISGIIGKFKSKSISLG